VTDGRVVLRRELDTEMGTFSAGCVFPAVRAGAGWRLDLLASHTVIVADADVYPSVAGLPLADAVAAAEYRFARNSLALTNTGALAWLAQRYMLTPAQLDRLNVDARLSRGVV
jgi:hypothetical protein